MEILTKKKRNKTLYKYKTGMYEPEFSAFRKYAAKNRLRYNIEQTLEYILYPAYYRFTISATKKEIRLTRRHFQKHYNIF